MQNEVLQTNGAKGVAHRDKHPDLCPICLHAVQPLQMATAVCCYEPNSLGELCVQVAYRCPRLACSALFIAQYTKGEGNKNFNLSKLMPQTPRREDLPDSIAEVSPSFVKIYNQANAAASARLDEIAGVGLRKALEFLIKDYCIRKEPSKAEEIKSIFLGKCIKDYVAEANIKRCAERATWLGNDETHYVRVWTAHDIGDLRILIKLTVNWIDTEFLTDKYSGTMPNN